MNADLRSFWLEFQTQCLDAVNNLQKNDDHNRALGDVVSRGG